MKTPSGDHFHLKTAGISPPPIVSRPSSLVPLPSSLVPRAPVGHDDPACRTFVSRPPPPGGFPKGGRGPPLVVSRGSGGKSEIPPEFFFGGLGVYSFNSERIHPQMPPSILGTPGRSASPHRGRLTQPSSEGRFSASAGTSGVSAASGVFSFSSRSVRAREGGRLR